MLILDIEHEIRSICARLYFGWEEKNSLPELKNAEVYRGVETQLAKLGLELVNVPECPWYLVRKYKEYDGFSQFNARFQNLEGRHLALILILYTKLLLPLRAGHVPQGTDLSVTFQQIYQTYGKKFVPRNRRTTPENSLRKLMQLLTRLGFLIKTRGQEVYKAGPALYMLHDELLTDIAEASINSLFGVDLSMDESAETEEDME
ncbi:MAG: hypothetical protein AB2421_14110 [Thermotaleaceae bacterium]